MTTTDTGPVNTNSAIRVTAEPQDQGHSRASLSASKRIRGFIGGVMDLMVEGLAPGVQRNRRSYDLIVVGAGSAGTAAALRAASQRIDTLLVEIQRAESRAPFIECIDYCASKSEDESQGISGGSFHLESPRFLVDVQQGLAVTGFRADGRFWQVETNQGHPYQAKALVLAPGMRRRRLGVPGEETFAGAGVHACAYCDGPAYVGRDVVVVGAGHAGMEQALFLASIAKSVTVVDKSARIRCHKELRERAKAHTNITVKLNRKVREFRGGRALTSVVVEDVRTGGAEELPTAAAFVSVGLQPATETFQGSVELTQNGFIKTDRNLQTSLPGVFAAGHARSRRIRGPEQAATDGYKAGSMVRRYLGTAERQAAELEPVWYWLPQFIPKP